MTTIHRVDLTQAGTQARVLRFFTDERRRLGIIPDLFSEGRWKQCEEAIFAEDAYGSLVGVVTMTLNGYRDKSGNPNGKPTLDTIYVAKKHRGKGLASQMFNTGLNRLFEQGAEVVCCDVHSRFIAKIVEKLPPDLRCRVRPEWSYHDGDMADFFEHLEKSQKPILFMMGPSGAGKTTLADHLSEKLRFLHINFDRTGDGVDIEGLRSEWNAFLDKRNPYPLAAAVKRRVETGAKNGAVITCPSGIAPCGEEGAIGTFLPPALIQDMESCGLRCIVVHGSRQDCLQAFLRRERLLNRGFGETHWMINNNPFYSRFSQPHCDSYRLQMFNNGAHRSLEDLLGEVQRRFIG